jgi:hypothetical protein
MDAGVFAELTFDLQGRRSKRGGRGVKRFSAGAGCLAGLLATFMATSGCVHDAMVGHPVKQLRRAAQRQIGALEKEIGFDIKVMRPQGRGLVDERDGSWYIVDPLFNEWLRRSSPRADRPVLEASDES